MSKQTIVVIGGGCAGVFVAARLLRTRGTTVVLAESAAAPGAGLAYGTAGPSHLLNSPARAMSAHPDHPDHFMAWLRGHGIPAEGGEFLPRRTYGSYLRDVLDEIVAEAGDRLVIRRAAVTAIHPAHDEVFVAFDTGAPVWADHAVVAVGNPQPQTPAALAAALGAHPEYVADPWRPYALRRIPATGAVLLIGTGLTAVDVVLSLTESDRHAAILAVSRHGLLPQPHRQAGPAGTGEPVSAAPDRLAPLLRAIRAAAEDCPDWRTIVDGVRGDVDRLWQGLGAAGQRRFLTHAARHWENHRHRMAPVVATRIEGLRAEGRLRTAADQVTAVSVMAEGFEVSFASGAVTRFAAVVNCTGPGRLPEAANPLVRSLLAEEVARLGPHRLGLDVDEAGRLRGRGGEVHHRVWVLGAMRRGRLWETTAVPEIRAQAAAVASAIHDSDRTPVIA